MVEGFGDEAAWVWRGGFHGLLRGLGFSLEVHGMRKRCLLVLGFLVFGVCSWTDSTLRVPETWFS
jgi:hypothetical protein